MVHLVNKIILITIKSASAKLTRKMLVLLRKSLLRKITRGTSVLPTMPIIMYR